MNQRRNVKAEAIAAAKGINLPKKIRFPVDGVGWARAQDRIRETGAINTLNNVKADAIETAKAAVKTAITGMAAHWRMAFSAAKATKGEKGIKGVSLNVLSYPKLPVISNGDPSFSLDWVYGHHDGLYVGLTIKTGPFAGLPVDVNFDTGEVGRPRGTISDRWGDTYPIEPYPNGLPSRPAAL